MLIINTTFWLSQSTTLTSTHTTTISALRRCFSCFLSERRNSDRTSGQVRSVCLTCTSRASCCSAHLSRTQVPAFAGSSVRDREKKGVGNNGGPPALAGTREYEQTDRNR